MVRDQVLTRSRNESCEPLKECVWFEDEPCGGVHLDGFGVQARKALMHAGGDGQGSHYLLYDYSTAARALRAVGADVLDTAARRHVRAAILRELARCRSADGSFVDNPLIGSVAGTGLALLAMLDLDQDPSGE